MAKNNSGPKNPWAANDNPWAEMGRLNLGAKEEKAPTPGSAPAQTVKANAANDVDGDEEKAPPVKLAATEELAKEESVEEEVVTFSRDDLEGFSIKELQEIARDKGIDPRGLDLDGLVDAILGDEAELITDEEEEEIELTDEEELEAEEIDGEMSLEEALALLGEDSETEEDFEDIEFEEVEVEVQEGDASFELDDNNSNG